MSVRRAVSPSRISISLSEAHLIPGQEHTTMAELNSNLKKGAKRKEPPQAFSNGQSMQHKGRDPKRAKMLDSRTILAQKPDAAFNNGELDLQAFLKSREFEIKALQDGMERSKSSRTTRAFQQVPRDLRRRTASHNVKRVPKRLHKRAAREMREDNTPTVDPSKRKPGNSRSRICADTAKRLGILAERKKAQKNAAGIETRPPRPKIRRDKLNDPPMPKSKFRKRQINKTWLPTHMWHAKRATMTEPKNPIWRFAMPMTSTEKSYRPTHRSGGMRGCLAWDMSYMSTVALEGTEIAIGKVLKAVGITESSMWEKKGQKWRDGKRAWNGWLSRGFNTTHAQIAPGIVLWSPREEVLAREVQDEAKKPMKRKVLIRVHPSAFLEVWEELLRSSKLQHPVVHIEDLRFEIGSIEITGPGSTETLLGILHPFTTKDGVQEPHADVFRSLAGLTNPASLPSNSVLSFSIFDPRLRYPPRPVLLPKQGDEEADFKLLETLSSWPADSMLGSSALFDRQVRYEATILPSQKALNRRKSLAPPGEYAPIIPKDPAIPIILLASRTDAGTKVQGTWTILAPWKCILPLWHGIVHYPLSSGANPRFGGLNEIRQVHFEHGVPWFPADFPGTAAGITWEEEQRLLAKAKWDRRPKGKRVEWDSLDLGASRKGEIGRGWACDFGRIVEMDTPLATVAPDDISQPTATLDISLPAAESKPMTLSPKFSHIQAREFELLLGRVNNDLPPIEALSTVRLTLLTRGVATQNARIYRLPSSPPTLPGSINSTSTTSSVALSTTKAAWLALAPSTSTPHARDVPKPGQKTSRMPLNVPLPKRIRLMAQSLLEPPPSIFKGTEEGDDYPVVPDADDLIGFVTTGSFSLAEGKGIAIGSVCVKKVLEGVRSSSGDGKRGVKEGRLCIVRNSGEKIGRLARWEVV